MAKPQVRLNISEFHKKILDSIILIFPGEKVETETSIQFDGKTLYLDIYLPKLKIAIECDGEQHNKFSKFFHGTMANFELQKKNDELKNRYCAAFGISVIRVQYKDKIDVDSLKKQILNTIRRGNA